MATTILLPVEIQLGMSDRYDIFVAICTCTVQQGQYVAVKSERWYVVFWFFVGTVQNVLHDHFFKNVSCFVWCVCVECSLSFLILHQVCKLFGICCS